MKRRMRTLLAGGIAALALGACTPQEAIDFVFADHSSEATAVATCESTMNPDAVSPGGANHGLFQINDVHRAEFEAVTGQPWAMVYDPYWNTVFAKWMYDQEGWRPWSCQP